MNIPIILTRDPADIVDKFCISKLKSERIDNEECHKEFLAFTEGIIYLKEKYPNVQWDMYCDLLLHIHDFLWQFEAGSKSGKEQLPSPHYIYDPKNKEVLSILGLINCEIKNYNSLRIKVKNIINKITATGFQEIKKDHLSEG